MIAKGAAGSPWIRQWISLLAVSYFWTWMFWCCYRLFVSGPELRQSDFGRVSLFRLAAYFLTIANYYYYGLVWSSKALIGPIALWKLSITVFIPIFTSFEMARIHIARDSSCHRQLISPATMYRHLFPNVFVCEVKHSRRTGHDCMRPAGVVIIINELASNSNTIILTTILYHNYRWRRLWKEKKITPEP